MPRGPCGCRHVTATGTRSVVLVNSCEASAALQVRPISSSRLRPGCWALCLGIADSMTCGEESPDPGVWAWLLVLLSHDPNSPRVLPTSKAFVFLLGTLCYFGGTGIHSNLPFLWTFMPCPQSSGVPSTLLL